MRKLFFNSLKDIILNWHFREPERAVLVDDRSPDTLEETIKATMTVAEAKATLKRCGFGNKHLYEYLKRIFE